jgi:hypothetical protein
MPADGLGMANVGLILTIPSCEKTAAALRLTAGRAILPAVRSGLPIVALKLPAVTAIVLAVVSRYSLNELARATGASPWIIRHYVKGKLLHPAVRAGQSKLFDDSHVVALGAIASLRAAGHRGRELAARVPGEIARVTAPPPAPAAPPVVESLPARRPTARDAVDAAVCAAAESLDISPRGLRVALEAVLRRLDEAGVSPGEAAALVGRAGNDR